MNEKLNTQDLIDLLAEKHGMSKKNADSFVKEFFLLIEKTLEKDKYVKIKGLGTFKLIDVDNRESVNVNTGQRFEIQGHTKISFTPEPTLRDVINRPFSHFETVALNDGTVLDDTLLENGNGNENEEEEEAEPKVSEAKNQAAEVVKEQPITIKPSAVIPSKQEQQEREPMPEQPKPAIKETADASTMRYFIGIVAFVVLLCGGAVVFMYYPDLLDQSTSKPPVEELVDAKKNEPVYKTVPADTIVKNETEPVKADTVIVEPIEIPKKTVPQVVAVTKEPNKVNSTLPESNSVEYTIAGTETTYKIQEGETLTKVSLRFYGSKTFWTYIVKHNPDVIKNPDNVPFGTTIKIPKLVKKQ